jgi:hypothetical protein
VTRAPLVLLPPSEGKAPGGDGPPWDEAPHRFPRLDDDRRTVLAALRDAMAGDEAARRSLLGVRGAALDAATRADLDAATAPTRPAVARYTGVLYDALDAGSLPPPVRRRLRRQVLVLSGLWGVVGADDPIPDYKLKMGARLEPLGRLAAWWRPRLSPVVDEVAAGRVVWDLLPAEHAAALDPLTSAGRVVRVRFVDDVARAGERRLVTVSHWNKLLKGALVRHLLTEQLDDPAGLDGFEHPEGYRFRPDLSDLDPARGPAVAVLVARR